MRGLLEALVCLQDAERLVKALVIQEPCHSVIPVPRFPHHHILHEANAYVSLQFCISCLGHLSSPGCAHVRQCGVPWRLQQRISCSEQGEVVTLEETI